MFGIVGLGRVSGDRGRSPSRVPGRTDGNSSHIRSRFLETSHMNDKEELPERKTPNHFPHPRDECDIIFLTVCTNRRMPILANDASHKVLRYLWHDTSHWRVGRYVIMPDHLHLFVQRASSGTIPLKRWMGWWKRDFSVALQLGSSIWQTDFWDTRIRSEAHYHAKWLYVRNNPVRHAAVRLPDEWEYQGEIYVLKA